MLSKPLADSFAVGRRQKHARFSPKNSNYGQSTEARGWSGYEGLNCLPSILASSVLVITFSGYAIFRLCLSQVIAFSGYCIFRLERFPVMPSSGSAKKTGLLHFLLCHLQSPPSMYAFLSPSEGQSRILIHGNYGNHKESKIEARLYYRSEKGGAFKSKVTIYSYLKLTPNDAHVSLSLSFFPFALTVRSGAVSVVLARDALP
jgi:hypothetical protein